MLLDLISPVGTWEDGNLVSNVFGNDKEVTNVVLFNRSIITEPPHDQTTPPIEQITFYQPGVGTSLDLISRLRAGAIGSGLMDNVREAYCFISCNWMPGDEIYLFGFSRGAYTARAVSGIISKFGLLTRRGMDGMGYVLDAYRRGDFEHPEKMEQLKYEHISNVPIKFIGVWETVGSLGIPDLYLLGWRAEPLDFLFGQINRQYQFGDTEIHPNVEIARHAYFLLPCFIDVRLALNEDRAEFAPTVWKLPAENNSTDLKQVWFAGEHSSVGGGDPTYGLSDIALAWMLQELKDTTGLHFDVKYLEKSRETIAPIPTSVPWACGPYSEPDTGIFILGGRKQRTPGKYLTQKEVDHGYETNEFVHESVMVRMKLMGRKYKHPKLDHLEVASLGDLEKKLKWSDM